MRRLDRHSVSRAGIAALVALAVVVASPLALADGAVPPDDLIAIRAFDRLIKANGEEVDCLVLSSDPDTAERIDVKIKTVRTSIPRSSIQSIVPRRTAEAAYENWQQWLRRETRPGGSLRDARRRAEAEFTLARWCRDPHPALGGRAPNAGAASEHFEIAARVDPSFAVVYPYLIAAYWNERPIDAVTDAEIDREVGIWMDAIASGYESEDVDFRLGELLVRRLDEPQRAATYFSRVLAKGSKNAGQARIARERLARLYTEAEEYERALELYPVTADAADPANFAPLLARARLRLRMGGADNLALARQQFTAAQTLQPEFDEVLLDIASLDYADGKIKEASLGVRKYLQSHPGDARATVDLALIDIQKGQFRRAEKSLRAVLAKSPPASVAVRAWLGIGSIGELREKAQEALTAYREAAQLDAAAVAPQLHIASTLIRDGSSDGLREARKILEALLSRHAQNRHVFGVASRLLALVEAASGGGKAGVRLEFAVDVDPDDAATLELAGLEFLRSGRLEQGLAYLGRAEKIDPQRPATLNGLAYYHYRRGNVSEADALLARSLAALKEDPAKGLSRAFVEDAKVYATEARRLIEDLDILQVSVDDFAGANDAQIDGWNEVELYGVEIKPVDGTVVYAGEQARRADGETGIHLVRPITQRDLERVSARLRIDAGRVSPSLRLVRPEGSSQSLAALEIFRGADGKVRVRTRSTRGEWAEPEVTAGPPEPGRRGKTWYPGTAAWAEGDREYHVLEIRRTQGPARDTRNDVFDVWFDGEVVALNVSAAGLSSKTLHAEIWARTDALGNKYRVTVDNFKLFRVRPGAQRRKP